MNLLITLIVLIVIVAVARCIWFSFSNSIQS
jgi:hypothetical protein